MKYIYIYCECAFLRTAVTCLIDSVVTELGDYKLLDLTDCNIKLNEVAPPAKVYILITKPKTKQIDSTIINFFKKIKTNEDKKDAGYVGLSVSENKIIVGSLLINEKVTITQLSEKISKLNQCEFNLYKNNLYNTLTNREFQVLHHLLRGRTVAETSFDMGISVKTLSVHKLRALRKMGYRI